jgi:2-keto-4-pentenoate hydratase/2-oxohepta-3-ene-1,7-dioic acid hydratase in catechol pathway
MSVERLICYQHAAGPQAAWVDAVDRVYELGPASELAIERLQPGEVALPKPGPELGALQLLPPLFGSRRVFAVGYNYRDHAAELTTPVPEWPNLFIRQPQSLVGHDAQVIKPAAYASYDYEGELAVVIGAGGRAIPQAECLQHVFGYTCLLDGSVREIQKHSLAAGKNFDRSGAMGPWIVPAGALAAEEPFRLRTTVNDEVRQQASSADMVFSIAELIHALSLVTELLPGDVISTGTPAGVGMSFDPPRYLKVGDQVQVTIAGIGALRVTVAAA